MTSDERLVFLLIATVSYARWCAIPDGRVSILESVAHYSRQRRTRDSICEAFVQELVRGGSLFS